MEGLSSAMLNGSEGASHTVAASLIDTPPERAFDRITALAARMLQAPISLVSVLDGSQNFFKSATGLPDAISGLRSVPLTHSYCKHVVASGQMLAVNDTLGHEVVGDNPTITQFGVRAYLGMPIVNPVGQVACSLCVLDMKPREWSKSDISILSDLAEILQTELMLREEVRARQQAEERALLLVREMEHRVKNSLSTVQALVSLTLKDVEGTAKVRMSLLERIASLATTHTLLGSDWKSVLVSDILGNELSHYASGDRLHIDAAGLRVGPADAVIVGMVFHELATNAVKYGALATGGELRIVCREAQEEARRRLLVEWRETGVPLGEDPARVGFGSTLLDTLVIRQHRGKLQRTWAADGLDLRMEMELADPDDA